MRGIFRRKRSTQCALTLAHADGSLLRFFTAMLREHAVAVGVDPGFRLLASGRARVLAGRVAERLLADRVETTASLGITDGDTTLLREALLRLYDAGGLVPVLAADPGPFAEALGRCCMSILAPLTEEDTPDEVVERIRTSLPGLLLSVNRLTDSTRNAHFDWKALRKLRSYRGMFRPRGGFPAFDQLLICARQALDQLIGACLDGQSVRSAETMTGLIAEFSVRYADEKSRTGVMDRADLYSNVRLMFERIPSVAERIRSDYPKVRVADWQLWTDEEREMILSIWPPESVVADSVEQLSSRSTIHAFVDHLFTAIGSEDEETTRSTRSKAAEGRIELLILPTSYVRTPDATYRRHRREAAVIAERMLQLESEGTDWCDMVVILPSGWDACTYERELLLRGIPACALAGYGFYDAPEIRDALGVLRLVADPDNQDSLFRVLISPFVGVSERTLAQINHAASESPYLPLWRILLECASSAEEDDSRRLNDFIKWMPELISRKNASSVGELLESALSVTSFDLKLLAMPLGLKRYANIRKLRQILAEPVELHEFLARMDESDLFGVGEQEAPIHSPINAVRIMTINQASGMHIPVVFLPDLSRRLGGTRSIYAFEQDRGLAVAPIADNGQRWMSLSFRETEAAAVSAKVEDEMSRLRTAMSCAEKRLVLVGCTDLNPNPRRAYSEILSAMGWLERALRLGPQTRTGALNLGPCSVDVRFAEPSAPAACSDEQNTLALRYRDDLRECLPIALEPDTATTETANRCLESMSAPVIFSRLSVSQALDYMECPARFRSRYILGLPDQSSEPPDDRDEDAYSAADLGQAVHDALSQVDFGRSIGDQIDNLTVHPQPRLSKEIKELLERFSESKWWTELVTADEILREIPFEIMVDGKVFVGRIDAMYRMGGEWTVLDYKTGRGEDKARYEMQVGIYAHAVHKLLGVMPARSALVLLTTGDDWVRDTCDGESAMKAISSIRQAVSDLDGGLFMSRPGAYCRWCAFAKSCPQESAHPK